VSDSTATGKLFAGVDVGASTAKAVVIDGDGAMLGHDVRPSGMDFAESGLGALQAALAMARRSRDQVVRLFATGYGRNNVPGVDGTRTEIAAHGKGAYHHHPHAMTVVDVGGQDNKIIKLDEAGKRLGFRMNRKCAAGTGAFLEEISARLAVPLRELNEMAARAEGKARLNSFCTVFASTELLSRIRAGEPREQLARGVFAAVVARVAEADVLTPPVMATGGVAAHNPAFLELLEEAVGSKILVPPHPQLVGALGAALFALQDPGRGADGGGRTKTDESNSMDERT